MKPNGLVAAASITSQMSMPMRVEDHLELVDQGDVDGAEDVLQQLGRLGRARCRRPARLAARRTGRRPARAAARPGRSPPTTFGMSAWRSRGCPGPRARASRRGRSRAPQRGPSALEERQHHLVGRARVGGALQHDELPGRRQAADRLGACRRRRTGRARAAARQRRRHADERWRRPRRAGRGPRWRVEPAAGEQPGHTPASRCRSRSRPASSGRDLAGVDVEAEDGEARARQG